MSSGCRGCFTHSEIPHGYCWTAQRTVPAHPLPRNMLIFYSEVLGNQAMPEAAAPSSSMDVDSKKEDEAPEPQLGKHTAPRHAGSHPWARQSNPCLADFGGNASLIEEAVRTQEPRSTVRALRNLVAIRARLTAEFLAEAVLHHTRDHHSLVVVPGRSHIRVQSPASRRAPGRPAAGPGEHPSSHRLPLVVCPHLRLRRLCRLTRAQHRAR